jgi:hypothetical protein
MSERITRRTLLRSVGAGAVTLTAAAGTTTATRSGLRERAKAVVADRTGTPTDDLTVVTDAQRSFPTLDESYYSAKVLDETDRSAHAALLDGDGEPVDRDALETREREAYRDRYGKRSQPLDAVVRDADADERVPVEIWVDGIDRAAARRAVSMRERLDAGESSRDVLDDLFAEFTRRTDARTRAVGREVAAVPGAAVERSASGAPVVEATATPAAIERVERLDRVRKLYHGESLAEPDIKEAGTTHGFYTDTDGDGDREPVYDLTGYDVGVFEAKSHPTASYLTSLTRRKNEDDTGEHASSVARCMACSSYYRPGSAQDAHVYSCQDPSYNADGKFAWFDDELNGGDGGTAQVVNMSLSWIPSLSGREDDLVMSSKDFYVNQQIFNRGLSVVVSAGNYDDAPDSDFDGEQNEYRTTSPSLGFNTLAVGSIDASDEGETSRDLSDDYISGFSCYESPKSAHYDSDDPPHKKPEVVGVGSDIDVPGFSGETQGTSFSAPFVAGLVESLWKVDKNASGGEIMNHPASAKAVLMAAATHDESDVVDQKWGTGTVLADRGEAILQNDWWARNYMSDTDDEDTHDIYLSEYDDEVTLVTAWLSDVDGSGDNAEAQSDVDLDVSVRDPDGNSVASSWEFDRGFEAVQFSPTKSGYYTLEINNWRWDNDDYRLITSAWHRE